MAQKLHLVEAACSGVGMNPREYWVMCGPVIIETFSDLDEARLFVEVGNAPRRDDNPYC